MATLIRSDSLPATSETLQDFDSVWHYDLSGQQVHSKNQDVKNGIGKQLSQHYQENVPLVDTTAALPLRSKRTERMQKKSRKRATKSEIKSFLDLPPELVLEVLTYLRPSDFFALMRVDRATQVYILNNEAVISNSIISLRYHILHRCFPLPILFSALDQSVYEALLSPRHQQRLIIHKAPYQHIKSPDPLKTCSCMACVMAWNNLCLLVDLAHWQSHLDRRDPITMISRGTRPQWNTELVDASAAAVGKALHRPLCYARILEMHLNTTARTIVRQAGARGEKGRRYAPTREVQTTKRLFHLSSAEIEAQTDDFMRRNGPPSFEFPFTRDNYYTLTAYLPNRRWDQGKWIYYGDLHERDLAWTKMIAEREARGQGRGGGGGGAGRDGR